MARGGHRDRKMFALLISMLAGFLERVCALVQLPAIENYIIDRQQSTRYPYVEVMLVLYVCVCIRVCVCKLKDL